MLSISITLSIKFSSLYNIYSVKYLTSTYSAHKASQFVTKHTKHLYLDWTPDVCHIRVKKQTARLFFKEFHRSQTERMRHFRTNTLKWQQMKRHKQPFIHFFILSAIHILFDVPLFCVRTLIFCHDKIISGFIIWKTVVKCFKQ